MLTPVVAVRAKLGEGFGRTGLLHFEFRQVLLDFFDGGCAGLRRDLTASDGDAAHVLGSIRGVLVFVKQGLGPFSVTECNPNLGGVFGVADGDDTCQWRRTIARTPKLGGGLMVLLQCPDTGWHFAQEAICGDKVFIEVLARFVVYIHVAASQQT